MPLRRDLALMPLVVALAAASDGTPVDGIIALVRAAVARGETDSQLAGALRRVEPAQSLDERVIEELEGEGAGPKTLAELERLRDTSRDLPRRAGPLPFVSPPPPSEEDQMRVLDSAREAAESYSRSLPDFICEEEVKRYRGSKRGWDLKDTLTLRLTYFGEKEAYKLLAINGKATMLPYQAVGGSITQGEFGSLLREVFERGEMRWDHWTHLRKRAAHVYAFRVKSADSRYSIDFRADDRGITAVTGQHGFVYVDRETNAVLRIASTADTIPPDFPVRSSSTLLDYEYTEVGGRRFLLPLRAEVRLGTDSVVTRNGVTFTSYRKFGAEANITYDAPR